MVWPKATGVLRRRDRFAWRIDGVRSATFGVARLSRPVLLARLRRGRNSSYARRWVTAGHHRLGGDALWHFRETGSGPPLVLLHGIGMSNAAWSAVTPYLESTRRVIAFDIAGFGSTPALPGGTPPTIPNLVDGLDRSIREVGLEIPVDLAGLPLEEARCGPCSDRVPGSARHGSALSGSPENSRAEPPAARAGTGRPDLGRKPEDARGRRVSCGR